jgi:hypothetical protein
LSILINIEFNLFLWLPGGSELGILDALENNVLKFFFNRNNKIQNQIKQKLLDYNVEWISEMNFFDGKIVFFNFTEEWYKLDENFLRCKK